MPDNILHIYAVAVLFSTNSKKSIDIETKSKLFKQSGNRILLSSNMPKNQPFGIVIDKLTRSIENAISGDSFKTLVLQLTAKDIKSLKQSDWLFNWKTEAKQKNKTIYKLVIVDNETVFQGLISRRTKATIYLCLLLKVTGLTGAQKNCI